MIEDKIIKEKKLPAIQFKLTKTQNEQLKPLFDMVYEAYMDEKRGMVLFRLDDSDMYCNSIAVFVPCKYAVEIQKIMSAYHEEYKNETP